MARRNPEEIERAEKEFDGYIREGMADSIWESAFITWREDVRDKGEVPKTPKAAQQAAADLAKLFAANHKDAGAFPLVRLFEQAVEAHTGYVPELDASQTPDQYAWPKKGPKGDGGTTLGDVAMTFGFYLAAQAQGEGISWFDSHKGQRGRFDDNTLRLPRFEAYYDGVYLNWTGAGTDERVGGNAVATLKRPGMHPFIVVRVNYDDTDTYASLIDGDDVENNDEVEAALQYALELANPDDGSSLHYAVIWAPNNASARLNAEHIDGDEWTDVTVDFNNQHGNPSRHQNPPRHVGSIMLIENDPLIAKATTRLLGKLYPDVAVYGPARTALEAISYLEKGSFDPQVDDAALIEPDLIISDYDLDEGTGGDVLAWIQTHKPWLASRFVFASGNDITESLHPFVVMKPFGANELKAVIASLPTPLVPNPGRRPSPAADIRGQPLKARRR